MTERPQGLHLASTGQADLPGILCITAGLVPFALEPKTQKLFLLLGQEVPHVSVPKPASASTTDSPVRSDDDDGEDEDEEELEKEEDKPTDEKENPELTLPPPPPPPHRPHRRRTGGWSDFGGRIQAKESYLEAAAREFTEECLGCVDLPGLRVNRTRPTTREDLLDYQAHVRSLLQDRCYLHRLMMLPGCEGALSGEGSQHCRVYFLMRVPWNPGIPKFFAQARSQLTEEHYQEKSQIRWWSLDRLNEILHFKGNLGNEWIRKGFLPALHVIVSLIKRLRRGV